MLSTGRSDVATPPPPCLGAEDLAAFMDGALPPSERQRALVHLDACPDCRDLLAESARALDRQQPTAARPGRWWPLAGLAAAAGLTVVLVRGTAQAPDRPGLPSLPPGPSVAESAPAPPAVTEAPPAADTPLARALVASAPAPTLLRHLWNEPEVTLGLGPDSQRHQAVLAGVYQTDLAVARAASGRDAVRVLRARVAALEGARTRAAAAAELGALLEAGRLAAAAQARSFFRNVDVERRLRQAAAREGEPARRKALTAAADRLARGPESAGDWEDLASAFENALLIP